MKIADNRFPSEVEIHPQHAGKLGEVLFTAMHEPPEPIPDILSEVCRNKVPEEAEIKGDKVRVRVSRDSDTRFYSVEEGNETSSWENDAKITVRYNVQDVVSQETSKGPSLSWVVDCPVEIKTGPRATTRNDQRAVMEYLAKNTEYQPIIVRLSINSLPASFSVTGLEIIEG